MATIVGKPQKRPAPITGGWLPSDPSDRLGWLEDFLKDIEKERSHGGFKAAKPLKQSVQELKDLIEDSAELSMLFRFMLEEIPFSHRLDPIGNEYKVSLCRSPPLPIY